MSLAARQKSSNFKHVTTLSLNTRGCLAFLQPVANTRLLLNKVEVILGQKLSETAVWMFLHNFFLTLWSSRPRKQLNFHALELCVTYLAVPSEPWLTRCNAPYQSTGTWTGLPARGTVGPTVAPGTNPSSSVKTPSTSGTSLANPSEKFSVKKRHRSNSEHRGRTLGFIHRLSDLTPVGGPCHCLGNNCCQVPCGWLAGSSGLPLVTGQQICDAGGWPQTVIATREPVIGAYAEFLLCVPPYQWCGGRSQSGSLIGGVSARRTNHVPECGFVRRCHTICKSKQTPYTDSYWDL